MRGSRSRAAIGPRRCEPLLRVCVCVRPSNNNNNNNIIFIWFVQKVITCKCYILRYNATQNHSFSNYNYITVNYLLTGRSVVCCFASKISQNSVIESQFACLYLVELDNVSRFILL